MYGDHRPFVLKRVWGGCDFGPLNNVSGKGGENP
jgi:hypothetical protein